MGPAQKMGGLPTKIWPSSVIDGHDGTEAYSIWVPWVTTEPSQNKRPATIRTRTPWENHLWNSMRRNRCVEKKDGTEGQARRTFIRVKDKGGVWGEDCAGPFMEIKKGLLARTFGSKEKNCFLTPTQGDKGGGSHECETLKSNLNFQRSAGR